MKRAPVRFLSVVCLVGICCAVAGTTRAEDWPSWRGPNFDGSAEGTFPHSWNLKKNVVWKVDLPSKAGSTPIVWGDHIFITATVDDKNALICFDRQGKRKWQVTLGNSHDGKHRKGSGCNPSPVTRGDRVYAYFKSGDLAAVDFAGNIIWHRNLQEDYAEDTLWWDLGTSPVLTSKYVVVACMQTGPSYVAAFDPATGEQVWKVDRDTGAPREAAQSYSTPIVTTYKGQEQIVVLGADYVTCHSAANGKEIWRVGTLNPEQEQFFRSIASPVIHQGVVVAPYARGNSLTAIRMGGEGDVTTSHVLWSNGGPAADVPTPAAHDGKVYICTDRGMVACIDLMTGKPLWELQTEKNRNAYSSSPVVTSDALYVTREDGKTFVISIAGEPKVIAENTLGDEFIVSTAVFVDGQVLLRTSERLYCIGE